MTDFTASERYLVELVNAARAAAGAQPLAVSAPLNAAADAHSEDMLARDYFDHASPDGTRFSDRMFAAGWAPEPRSGWRGGENIAGKFGFSAVDPAAAMAFHHDQLMNSSGHRANILNAAYSEIGVGQAIGAFTWQGRTYPQSSLVTQVFADGGRTFITGVAIEDDGDGLYDVGEGLGGVTVTVTGSGGTVTATTAPDGGYAVSIAPFGTYEVIFSGGGIGAPVSRTVTVSDRNVKVDAFATEAPEPEPEPVAPAPIEGTAGPDLLAGTAADDTLLASAGDDTLIGGGGDDRLEGGAGFDVAAYGDATGPVAADLAAGTGTAGGVGRDAFSSIEGLLGSAFDDSLAGDGGDNLIDGGAGADTMAGGAGDDTFRIDDAGDAVLEDPGGGRDTVLTTVSVRLFALSQEVEALVVEGTADLVAVGNRRDNRVEGNAGDNVINGARGDDTLIGGLGDDTFIGAAGADVLVGGPGDDHYVLDEAADTVVEAEGEGIDTVLATVDVDLGRFGEAIETLILDGTGDLAATGNGAANTVLGNGGDNLIDGGAGADTLIGGAGDDTFVVDDAADVLEEDAGGGFDTVLAMTSFDLNLKSQHIEALKLSGSGAVEAFGNTGDNLIEGNAADNVLRGRRGEDTLAGGAGDDSLHGGGGADVFVVGPGGGADVIVNFAPGVDALDLAAFDLGDAAAATLGATETAEGVTLALSDATSVLLKGLSFDAIADDVLI